MSIEERIIMALDKVGIIVDYEKGQTEDIDLREFFADSMQFMASILELENEFDIEFPDEYMLLDKFASLKGLSSEIEEFLQKISK